MVRGRDQTLPPRVKGLAREILAVDQSDCSICYNCNAKLFWTFLRDLDDQRRIPSEATEHVETDQNSV